MNSTTQTPETWEDRIAREARERETCMIKLREIAKALNYKITKESEKDNHCAFVDAEGPDGVMLYMTGEAYRMKGRIEIVGDFPTDTRGQDTRGYVLGYGQRAPRISVDSARPTKQIVTAIQNRLLPVYRPLLTKAQQLIASWESHQLNRDSDFKTVIGRAPANERELDGKFSLNLGKLEKNQEYDCGADIQISSSGVKLTIDSLPAHYARAVLDMLKAHKLKK